MEHRDEIGFQVRTLSNLIKRLVDQTAFQGRERPATGMHGWVIGYLYENRNRDVFQRDLQEQFSIRRSTVTGILQLMEKNGLITRQSVDEDARLKKIVSGKWKNSSRRDSPRRRSRPFWNCAIKSGVI